MWPASRRLRLYPNHPPITTAELAVQLELELHFHGSTAFAARLRRALAAAYQQGLGQSQQHYKKTRRAEGKARRAE